MDKQTMYAAGALALAAAGAVLWHKKQQSAAQAAAAPPMAAPAGAVGAPALAPPPSAQVGKPEVPKALSTFGTISAGIKLQNAIGDIGTAVAGKGVGDVARVAPGAVAGAAIIAGKGVQLLVESAGAPKGIGITVGVGTAVALAVGAPAAAGAAVFTAGSQVAKGVVKGVFGEQTYKNVSSVVRQFDPTLPGSVANKPIQVASAAVKGIGKALKGIF